MIDNLTQAARNEYSAGFVGTPWMTWGLFFFFAVSMIVFTLSIDAWLRGRI